MCGKMVNKYRFAPLCDQALTDGSSGGHRTVFCLLLLGEGRTWVLYLLEYDSESTGVRVVGKTEVDRNIATRVEVSMSTTLGGLCGVFRKDLGCVRLRRYYCVWGGLRGARGKVVF